MCFLDPIPEIENIKYLRQVSWLAFLIRLPIDKPTVALEELKCPFGAMHTVAGTVIDFNQIPYSS